MSLLTDHIVQVQVIDTNDATIDQQQSRQNSFFFNKNLFYALSVKTHALMVRSLRTKSKCYSIYCKVSYKHTRKRKLLCKNASERKACINARLIMTLTYAFSIRLNSITVFKHLMMSKRVMSALSRVQSSSY